MFIIGALPGLIVLPLARLLPESPRWLANRGRYDEADRVLSRIEAIISQGGARPLPPDSGRHAARAARRDAASAISSAASISSGR